MQLCSEAPRRSVALAFCGLWLVRVALKKFESCIHSFTYTS